MSQPVLSGPTSIPAEHDFEIYKPIVQRYSALCIVAMSTGIEAMNAGQDFTSRYPKHQTIPPTGWTAIRPRIVTGVRVNQVTKASAFVPRTARLATRTVTGDIATSAKVFFISS